VAFGLSIHRIITRGTNRKEVSRDLSHYTLIVMLIDEIIHTFMDIVMPPAFPEVEFRGFGLAATKFFPALLSHEALYDPQEKRRQFDWSWQAVRYRYRSCAECQDEFKSLFGNASEAWRAGLGDEELTFKLERCIYMFFMSGLSVFDSLSFCLYFLGNAVACCFSRRGQSAQHHPQADIQGFQRSIPASGNNGTPCESAANVAFSTIDEVRNLLAHRISGRRSVRSSGTLHADGTHTTDCKYSCVICTNARNPHAAVGYPEYAGGFLSILGYPYNTGPIYA
jgi:hypothetical protein